MAMKRPPLTLRGRGVHPGNARIVHPEDVRRAFTGKAELSLPKKSKPRRTKSAVRTRSDPPVRDLPTPKPLDFWILERAWWQWVDANCPHTSARARGKWMSANTFEYDGTTWTRSWQPVKSNSGKSIVDSITIFYGADRRRFHKAADRPKNRRSDPDRNWGLPE
jgi:hypothetical protein